MVGSVSLVARSDDTAYFSAQMSKLIMLRITKMPMDIQTRKGPMMRWPRGSVNRIIM